MSTLWWLFGHAWWGLPTIAALVAAGFALLGAWPLLLALIGRIPPRLLILIVAVLAALIAGSGLYAVGLDHGEDRCKAAAAAAQRRMDERAKGVHAESAAKAEDITARVTKETANATERVRTIVRTVPATCPAVPDELRDELRRAVEAARARLPETAGDAD